MLLCPAEMFKQSFWMHHLSAPTMKRTTLWSTSAAVVAFRVFAHIKKDAVKPKPESRTTEHYVNGHGEVAYKGSSALKASQNLGRTFRVPPHATSCNN